MKLTSTTIELMDSIPAINATMLLLRNWGNNYKYMKCERKSRYGNYKYENCKYMFYHKHNSREEKFKTYHIRRSDYRPTSSKNKVEKNQNKINFSNSKE